MQDNGIINYDSDQFFKAINNARRWVKNLTPISSSVLKYREQESLETFLQGKAAFLRSWPYAYATLKRQYGDRLGVAPLPHGKDYRQNVGVLGGAALAVPQRSPNKFEALKFMQYLTSEPVQKWRAELGSHVPPGGGAPPKINDVTKQIDVIVVRTSGEKAEKDYSSRSGCFVRRVRDAIDSGSEEEVHDKISAIKSCQLTKVVLKKREK